MKKLMKKVAIVTGGASGIGAAIAELFAREGAAVAVTDIDDKGAAQVAASIVENGGKAIGFQHDVAAETAWIDVVKAVRQQLGPIDILVNNAGIPGDVGLVDMPYETWRQIMGVNCDGVFLGMKHVVPAMPTGGSIINLSSIYGKVGGVCHIAYSASKGAVALMSKSAALECADKGRGIRVNSLHPGYVETPMFNRMEDERKERYRQMHPIGRVGQAEEIASAALFLASEASSFMTGAELVVDGGYTAR